MHTPSYHTQYKANLDNRPTVRRPRLKSSTERNKCDFLDLESLKDHSWTSAKRIALRNRLLAQKRANRRKSRVVIVVLVLAIFVTMHILGLD